MMRGKLHKIILLAAVLSLSTFPDVIAGELENAQKHIANAESYYWVGLAENGNVDAFREGLVHVEKARSILKLSAVPPAQSASLLQQAAAIDNALRGQEQYYRDRFYGIFPLVRLLKKSLFSDESATGTFELLRMPDVVAVTKAAKYLSGPAINDFINLPQMNVVVSGDGLSPLVEERALSVLNSSTKLFARSTRQVANLLSPDEYLRFRSGRIDGNVVKSLAKGFRCSHLLVVKVVKINEVDGIVVYVLEGEIWQAGQATPAYSTWAAASCRDRRSRFVPIVTANGGFLVLSGLLMVVVSFRRGKRTAAALNILKGLFLFLFVYFLGRFTPWVIASLASTIVPDPEMEWILSAWWPCFVVALFVLGPVVVFHILTRRVGFGGEWRSAPMYYHGVYISIALGVTAHLAVSLFLYLEGQALLFLAMAGVAVVATSLMLGLSLEHRTRNCYGVIAFVLALWLGLFLCMLRGDYLFYGTAASVIAVSLALFHNRLAEWLESHTGRKPTVMEERATPPVDPPATLEELIRRAEKPRFVPSEALREAALSHLTPALEGTVAHLAFVGESKSGKSQMASQIIRELQKELESRGTPSRVLMGWCAKPEGPEDSYAPVRSILGGLGHRPFDLQTVHEKGIDDFFEAILHAFLPLAAILFPKLAASGHSVFSRDEVHNSAFDAVAKMSQRMTVIVLLEDVQWIDGASKALLVGLIEEFPQGSDTRLVIVLTCDREDALGDICASIPSVEIPGMTFEQQSEFLHRDIALDDETSRRIIDQLPRSTKGNIDPSLFFHVIKHMAREGVLVKREDGRYCLKTEFANAPALPFPKELNGLVEEQLRRIGDDLQVLECAACIGMRVPVSVLAESLTMSRYHVLRALRNMEIETGFISASEQEEDCYTFNSPMVLESVRQLIKMSSPATSGGRIPMFVQEIHSRIAHAYEKAQTMIPNAAAMAYHHYSLAGSRHISDAVRSALQAARVGITTDTVKMEEFLQFARSNSHKAGLDKGVEEEILLIECDASHFVGYERSRTAERGLEYLAGNPGASTKLLIVVTRAVYDAAGVLREEKERKTLYGEVVSLGRRIVESARSESEKAEGYQFIGLGFHWKDPRHIENIEEAWRRIEKIEKEDASVAALKSRVANSLAQAISSDDSRLDEAEKLFRMSIEIKSAGGDMKGLAISYGGLGRLNLRLAISYDGSGGLILNGEKIEKAKEYFRQDLDISRKIGDRPSQSMMNSLLGMCALLENSYPAARMFYAEALELAGNSQSNEAFARIGLIRSLNGMKDFIERDREAGILLEYVHAVTLSADINKELKTLLSECREKREADWIGSMSDRIFEKAE